MSNTSHPFPRRETFVVLHEMFVRFRGSFTKTYEPEAFSRIAEALYAHAQGSRPTWRDEDARLFSVWLYYSGEGQTAWFEIRHSLTDTATDELIAWLKAVSASTSTREETL